MEDRTQEGARRPFKGPVSFQSGGGGDGRRSVQGTAHQQQLGFSLLAVPTSSLLGLGLPTIGLDPLIVFRMWAANLWGSLMFAAGTFALVYFVLNTRPGRVESWIVVALGTTMVYILSFSLAFMPGAFGADFFEFKMTIGPDLVANVIYWGWPGIVGSMFYVDRVRLAGRG